MIVERLKWYRVLRGGRWARTGPRLFSRRWLRLPLECAERPDEIHEGKIRIVDFTGWPVVGIIGHPVVTLLRKFLWGRGVVRRLHAAVPNPHCDWWGRWVEESGPGKPTIFPESQNTRECDLTIGR